MSLERRLQDDITVCFLGLPLGLLPFFRFCTSFSCSLKTHHGSAWKSPAPPSTTWGPHRFPATSGCGSSIPAAKTYSVNQMPTAGLYPIPSHLHLARGKARSESKVEREVYFLFRQLSAGGLFYGNPSLANEKQSKSHTVQPPHFNRRKSQQGSDKDRPSGSPHPRPQGPRAHHFPFSLTPLTLS